VDELYLYHIKTKDITYLLNEYEIPDYRSALNPRKGSCVRHNRSLSLFFHHPEGSAKAEGELLLQQIYPPIFGVNIYWYSQHNFVFVPWSIYFYPEHGQLEQKKENTMCALIEKVQYSLKEVKSCL
jgi:hypothetical protein